MHVGILRLTVEFPGCASLKEKRSRLKPLLARLRREFNVSVAEVERQDAWQEAVIACALVSNAEGHIQRALQAVIDWIDNNWPDASLIDDHIEVL
jgi:uncharacterized protein